jgi:hypothetical protein
MRKSIETWAEVEELDGLEEVRDFRVTVSCGGIESDYRITLTRFDVVHVGSGTRPASRWIVTRVREQPS